MNNKTKSIVMGGLLVAVALVFFPKLYVSLASKLGKKAEIQKDLT